LPGHSAVEDSGQGSNSYELYLPKKFGKAEDVRHPLVFVLGMAGANQKWSLPTNGNGGIDGVTGYVQNQYSGMCIETDGVAGNAVYQAPCNGSARQQWHFSDFQVWNWSDLEYVTYYHITNPNSGLELNANQDRFDNGTAVIVWPSQGQNDVDNEAWQITW